MILEFQKSHFDLSITSLDSRRGHIEPPWLTSCGDKDKLPGIVSEIVHMVQTTERMQKGARDPDVTR